MTLKRCAAVAILAAGFAGCHDDPEVIEVIVNAINSTTLTITTDGGSGSDTSVAVGGTGGAGGAIQAFVTLDLNCGAPTTTLVLPTTPSAPTTGTAINPGDLSGADVLGAGNLILSGSVDATTGNRSITSTTGDIVISGTLRSSDAAGAYGDLTLTALNGTIYVTGTIRTGNWDGVQDGEAAGALTLNARRIVITGTIDASGEGQTAGGGDGGDGGTVNVMISGGGDHIYFTAGSITSSGGSITGAGTGNLGGNGGPVTITAPDRLYAFGSITTDGGARSVSVAGTSGVFGGNAGAIGLFAGGATDVAATLNARGGDAANNDPTEATTAGDGGPVTVGTIAPVRCYGTWSFSGGNATNLGAGGQAVQGGTGGDVNFGTGGARLVSLETGVGTYSVRGGAGEVTGGSGGDVAFETDGGGLLTMAVTLDTRGADSSGGVGGDGGTVLLDNRGGSAHIVSSGTINSSGGAGAGTGAADGGLGGAVTLTTAATGAAGGTITVTGSWTANGGGSTSATGDGGAGAIISLSTPDHAVSLGGVIAANGGTSTNGTGGPGGRVVVNSDADFGGADGIGGNITLQAASTINVSGGGGSALGGSAGNDLGVGTVAEANAAVVFDADDLGPNSVTGGIVQNLGSITASGGNATGGASAGGLGGDILFDGRDTTGAAATTPAAGTQTRAGGLGTVPGLPGDFDGE
jgi:hypothetical protein